MKKTLIIISVCCTMALAGCNHKESTPWFMLNNIFCMVADNLDQNSPEMWSDFSTEKETEQNLADLINYSLCKDFSPVDDLVFKVDTMEYIGNEQYKIRFVCDTSFSTRGNKNVKFHFIVNTVDDAVSMGAKENKYCHLKWEPMDCEYEGRWDRLPEKYENPIKEWNYHYWIHTNVNNLTLTPCE